jgi:hypothetical protein
MDTHQGVSTCLNMSQHVSTCINVYQYTLMMSTLRLMALTSRQWYSMSASICSRPPRSLSRVAKLREYSCNKWIVMDRRESAWISVNQFHTDSSFRPGFESACLIVSQPESAWIRHSWFGAKSRVLNQRESTWICVYQRVSDYAAMRTQMQRLWDMNQHESECISVNQVRWWRDLYHGVSRWIELWYIMRHRDIKVMCLFMSQDGVWDMVSTSRYIVRHRDPCWYIPETCWYTVI